MVRRKQDKKRIRRLPPDRHGGKSPFGYSMYRPKSKSPVISLKESRRRKPIVRCASHYCIQEYKTIEGIGGLIFECMTDLIHNGYKISRKGVQALESISYDYMIDIFNESERIRIAFGFRRVLRPIHMRIAVSSLYRE